MLSLAPVENSRPVLIDSRFELSKTIAMPGFHFIFSLSRTLLIDYCKNELGLAFAMTEWVGDACSRSPTAVLQHAVT
jgi:hypothetical protein